MKAKNGKDGEVQMAGEIIKWDVEELNSAFANMNEAKNGLKEQRDFFENINAIIQYAWKGYAGTVFEENIDSDINSFDSLISELEDLNNDLKKVIDGCYSKCEETVANEIRTLVNSILG